MKLKSILTCLIIVSMVFFGGCKKNQLVVKYVISDQESQIYEVDQNISSLIDNTSTLESVKISSVDIHDFVQKHFPFALPYTYRMSELSNDMGLGLLRETEEGALYSVYPVDQGGKLLVFYNNEEWQEETDDRSIMRWFYVREELCFDDFKELIENKCSIEEVIRVDETEQIFKNLWFGEWLSREPKPERFGSWHYLSDGILELAYEKNEKGAVLVDYAWHPDFQLDDWQAAMYTPYNARVLDIDCFSR
ncbi:MAG: hypothetical protein J6Q42_05830 [Clostridia bacterium]|nr:hypothetical protein [Clostridia bacterium]